MTLGQLGDSQREQAHVKGSGTRAPEQELEFAWLTCQDQSISWKRAGSMSENVLLPGALLLVRWIMLACGIIHVELFILQ